MTIVLFAVAAIVAVAIWVELLVRQRQRLLKIVDRMDTAAVHMECEVKQLKVCLDRLHCALVNEAADAPCDQTVQ